MKRNISVTNNGTFKWAWVLNSPWLSQLCFVCLMIYNICSAKFNDNWTCHMTWKELIPHHLKYIWKHWLFFMKYFEFLNYLFQIVSGNMYSCVTVVRWWHDACVATLFMFIFTILKCLQQYCERLHCETVDWSSGSQSLFFRIIFTLVL